MKNRIIMSFFFIVFIGLQFQAIAQFTPEELAEREKWEEFLKTAEIAASDQPWLPREDPTLPWRLTLEKDGVSRQAIWKYAEGRIGGFRENWRWEIAAYCLDKYLKLNMIPPTVERRYQGNRGSCQLLVNYWIRLLDKNQKDIKTPSNKILSWDRALYLQRAFDNLIANIDRYSGYILITKDWRMILIDHSRSFGTSNGYTKKLIYDKNHRNGPMLMKQLPKTFVEKLKSLNHEVIKEVVGEYLTDKEIEAVLIRRDLILKEIDNIKTVLY